MTYKDLHEYQKIIIHHLVQNKNAAVFLDMGMGKTISCLYAFNYLKQNNLATRMLIIAPKFVALYTWKQEIEKWFDLKLSINIAVGRENQREGAFLTHSDIVIINRDNITWMVKNVSVKSFNVLCIDELSSFKSYESKRVTALSKILHRFDYRWGLTGTPVPNGYLDLFSQIYMLDPGRFGDNFWRFRNKYFHEVTKFRWALSEGSKEKIDEKIKDIAISMRAEDYLTMPKKIINDIKITMDDKTYTIYKKALYQTVYDRQTNQLDLSGNIIIKLQQISNGFVYLNSDWNYEIVHTLMTDKLEELLDTITGNTLLFYSFRTDKEIIQKRFNATHLQQDQDFDNWNDGKIRLAIAHPNSLAYGVNLQSGGNNIIWYGLNYSQELYEQANARLYRQGQKNGVIIHNLYVTNTIQDRIKMILKGKIKQSDLLFEAVKYVKELY